MHRNATDFCIWLSFYLSLGVINGQDKAYCEGFRAKNVNIFLRLAVDVTGQFANTVSVRMDNT